VPVGGIGCQAHLSIPYPAVTPAEHVQKTLDRLAQFNLPVKITECVFIFDDEETRVRELNKLFPVYFAHPSVEAIIFWGFWAGAHWKPHAALWTKDWTPTPQALAYRDLVFNKWWTNISGKADEKGIFRTRGFFGEYDINSNGQSKKVTLAKKDKAVEIRFK
jgi:GH35 family endo-1,4-beta-xylanase